MLKKLIDQFRNSNKDEVEALTVERAAAALMIEIATADQQWDPREESQVRDLLSKTMSISDAEVEELLVQAKQDASEAVDLYQFTALIRDQYSIEEKRDLLTHLWRIAYADDQLDKYEDYIIRKIADLIYVPHSAFIQAKQMGRQK